MKITFLGTNGWYDTETGNTSCILIETGKEYIILDAGNGIYKIPRYIKKRKPVYLFLSHFHFDHIIGLHILAKFGFLKELKIFGQPGTRDILKRVIARPFTISFRRLPFRVKVREISEGVHRVPFLVKSKFLLHSAKCMGYRFEINGKAVSYCPDTGLCKNVFELAKNADLLISECSYKIGERSSKWPHLNPGDAAGLAKKAGVGRLILTHFDAGRYLDFAQRKKAEGAARKIFKHTSLAYDDKRITL